MIDVENRKAMEGQGAKGGRSVTILLTSAGGLTGVYLCKHFKKTGNYRIVAIDMSTVNALGKWADFLYTVPSVKDSDYIPKVKKIVLRENVDIIIPVTSYDVDIYSRSEVRREFDGTGMLLMDYAENSILSDKKTCYEYLKSIGICAPQIFGSLSEAAGFPVVLKPRVSSGSKNTFIINDIRDYEYWSGKINDCILVQYLEGREYTVDCLFAGNGRCLGANVRERVKMNGGGAVTTRNDYSIDISSVVSRLEHTGKIAGPVNFQFKLLPDGTICIFDFNTRFASGGLPLTVESGFDIPNMLVQLILTGSAKAWQPDMKKNGLTMIRYYEEYFTDG